MSADKRFVTYPAIKPTAILVADHAGTKVVVTLYGHVTDERRLKEQQEAEYRALQLTPLPPRKVREFIPREDMEDFT